jgi:pyruvate/2-oxoglutarate dehydrogenase complex dihydrolipoamide acyltransferase (E2) component
VRFTVTLPSVDGLTNDTGVVAEWRKQIGEMVGPGDVLAVVGATEVPSPAFGILAKMVVLPGEAIEVGEPLAVLSGVPEPLVTGQEKIPEPFAVRPAYVPGGPEEVRLLSSVEQAVARHMERSVQASPHVFTVATVDMSEVVRLSERSGLPGLPFVVHATAESLTRYPLLNAQMVGEAEVRLKRYVHVAVARRTTGNNGGRLTAPVLRDADTKSLMALARELGDLFAAADAGTLTPDTQRGATFTVAEAPGGVLYQTPILHQPQSAQLSIGAIARTPIASEDDTVTVRPVAHLCLAHDARLIDGNTAAAFLSDIKRGLEEARFLFA